MLEAIFTQPDVCNGKGVRGQVETNKLTGPHLVRSGAGRATILVLQTQDKSRNDIAADIITIIRKVHVFHPIEIATWSVENSIGPGLLQKVFEGLPKHFGRRDSRTVAGKGFVGVQMRHSLQPKPPAIDQREFGGT